MTLPSSNRLWTSTVLRWTASAALLLLGGKFLAVHITTVRDVRASSLPLAQEIPALERRVSILKEQQELTELSHALRVGSPEEKVHVYALPNKTDIDKVITAFDVFAEELRHQKTLMKISPMVFGEAALAENGIRTQSLTFEATLHRDGIAALQTFVRLGGLLSVADALRSDERSRLLLQTELENPAAIVALEQFLNTDLLSYLREPRPAEEQLLKSFSNQSFERAFRDIVRNSLLADAGRLLTPEFMQTLHDAKLWPMQMMDMEAMSLEVGGAAEWYRVKVKVVLFMRAV